MTPKDISDLKGGKYLASTPRSLTESGLRSCSAELLPANSVLFSSRAPIGLVAINKSRVATNQGFKSFVPDRSKLDPDFLYHWLRCNRESLERLGVGATFKEVSKGIVSRIQIPLPPLEEQRRIAAILDKAEELRAKRRATLALLDQLPQAIFLEMFANSNTYRDFSVGELASKGHGGIRTGPFGSQLLHSEFTNSGVSVLGIDNAVKNTFQWAERRYISARKYEELKRYTVRPGDVLVTIMGTCGRCAVVPADVPLAINTKHLCCISLDHKLCLPEFLHAYFLYHPAAREYLAQTTKGAIMGGLNMGIIRDMPVKLPPAELQETFVQKILGVSKHVKAVDYAGSLVSRVSDSIQASLL